jgi:hypothetical protein
MKEKNGQEKKETKEERKLELKHRGPNRKKKFSR